MLKFQRDTDHNRELALKIALHVRVARPSLWLEHRLAEFEPGAPGSIGVLELVISRADTHVRREVALDDADHAMAAPFDSILSANGGLDVVLSDGGRSPLASVLQRIP
jgi:hypothetical protein